ncbi:MAG: hypothetical protein IPK14_20095 [Blastocatellia bacterium]|nr:hypothetical protein [Blastocatellia bacterium]
MNYLELILITTIAMFTVVLLVAVFKLYVVSKQLMAQATLMQAKVEENLKRLQSRTEPLLEDARQKLQLLQTEGKPILEETHKLIIAARPAMEQINELLVLAKPILAEAYVATQLAKETAQLTKEAAKTIKVESESCLAAIKTTTQELAQLTKEEAEEMRVLVGSIRERTDLQVQRVDKMVTRTTDRLDQTAEMVQTGVLKPIHEISAVLSAVQTFLGVLFAQERKQIDEAYQDEEMFI